MKRDGAKRQCDGRETDNGTTTPGGRPHGWNPYTQYDEVVRLIRTCHAGQTSRVAKRALHHAHTPTVMVRECIKRVDDNVGVDILWYMAYRAQGPSTTKIARAILKHVPHGQHLAEKRWCETLCQLCRGWRTSLSTYLREADRWCERCLRATLGDTFRTPAGQRSKANVVRAMLPWIQSPHTYSRAQTLYDIADAGARSKLVNRLARHGNVAAVAAIFDGFGWQHLNLWVYVGKLFFIDTCSRDLLLLYLYARRIRNDNMYRTIRTRLGGDLSLGRWWQGGRVRLVPKAHRQSLLAWLCVARYTGVVDRNLARVIGGMAFCQYPLSTRRYHD